MGHMRGKVVVITGASSGIGASTARRLHGLGAAVVLGARRGDRLKELVYSLGDERAIAVEADVRSRASVAGLFDFAVDRFGQVDCLIANAGIGVYGGILDMTDSDIREIIETNLTGSVWCVREAVPYLREQGGDIVLVSSVAGLRGKAHEAVYAATKHGLVGLAGSLDRELLQYEIRVTAMCPGATATGFALERGRDASELSTMMQPDDVAEAISFALSQPRSMRTLLWSMRSMHSEN